MKIRSSVLPALALVLVVGAVVAVGDNDRVVIVREVNIEPGTETVADCGGYLVLEDFYGKTMMKLQYDKDGNLVKMMQHGQTLGHTTFYNSANPEIAIQGGPEGIVLNIDYRKGTFMMSGLNYKVTLPGVGMIFHQGGHYTFDPVANEWTQVGGPDDFFSGNVDKLCAALAP
jgi:hypothetical protein